MKASLEGHFAEKFRLPGSASKLIGLSVMLPDWVYDSAYKLYCQNG